MYLTTRSRYGTRLLLDIAENQTKGAVPISEISKRQDVSVKYLEMIIRDLKRGGYIISKRGARGGHMLAKAPEQITVGEIIELLEGNTSIVPCAEDDTSCDRSDRCPTRWVWQEVSRTVQDKLNSITFATLLEVCRKQKNQKK